MSTCAVCTTKIKRDVDAVSCALCNAVSHAACVGVSDVDKKSYECTRCSTDKRMGPVLKAILAEMESKIMKKLSTIEDSQNFVCRQYDDLKTRIEEIAKLQETVGVLEKKVQEKDAIIVDLTVRLAKVEQYSRRAQLEIREVTEQKNENVEEIVIKVASELGVKLQPSDIEAAHRLPAKEGRTKPIIVQFSSRKTRDQVFGKRRTADITNNDINGLGTQKIFIGESLSPYFRDLLIKAKQAGLRANWAWVWFSRGSVLAKKTDKGKTVPILHAMDLSKIL